MKKTFALLMLATMLFSVGCGNQAQDAAKDAQQKVEQKADEAKAKVDEMKSDADKMAKDAAAKVDEMATDMTSMMNERVIALNGLMPGASVEDVQAMFGEATKVEGNEMIFADGLKVVLDGAKKVKSISTVVDSFETPEGMYVGASEYSLNDNCGPADSVRKIANGAEYEYNSGDKKSIVVYKAENGIITEITCTLK